MTYKHVLVLETEQQISPELRLQIIRAIENEVNGYMQNYIIASQSNQSGDGVHRLIIPNATPTGETRSVEE